MAESTLIATEEFDELQFRSDNGIKKNLAPDGK